MAESTIMQLQTLVSKLQSERQEHVDSIAAIDAVFGGLGISPDRSMPGRRGRKKGAVAPRADMAKRSTGQRFNVPGPESILQFVRKAGSNGVSGAEIDRHWKRQGRAGSAYNILGQLVEMKRLRRQKVQGGRGSVYWAA